MNSAIVDRLRMAASVNGRKLTNSRESKRQSISQQDKFVEDFWTLEKFKQFESGIDIEEGTDKLNSNQLSEQLNRLTLAVQKFLIGSIHFFEKGIAKHATVPLEDLILLLRKIEPVIFADRPEPIDIEIDFLDRFVDSLSGFYIGLDCLLSAKEMAARIGNDEGILVKISSLICDNIFNPPICNRLIGDIKSVLEGLWGSEEFFKLILAFGITYLEKGGTKTGAPAKRGEQTSNCQKLFFEFITKSMTKIATVDNFQTLLFTNVFNVEGEEKHFAYILEDPKKLKILKHLTSYLIKFSDFETQFFWMEFLCTRLNTYLAGIIQFDAGKKAQAKCKNARAFFAQFYSQLLSRKIKTPIAPGLSWQSFCSPEYTLARQVQGENIPLAAEAFFAIDSRASSKKSKQPASIVEFKAFLLLRNKSKPSYDVCQEEWVKRRKIIHMDLGYLQLVFSKQLNMALETATKIFLILSNREENDHLRSAMFSFFDDNYNKLGLLFFIPSTTERYFTMLANRSNDSFSEIRITAMRICKKIIGDDYNQNIKYIRRQCMGLAISRLKDSEDKVILPAVESLNSGMSIFNDVAPSKFDDKALNEITMIIGGSLSQDKYVKEAIDKLAFNLFFSDPDIPSLEPSKTRQEAISARKSKTTNEPMSVRAMAIVERVKRLLAKDLSDSETHRQLTKLLDRACRYYTRECTIDDQTATLDMFVQLTLETDFKQEACYLLQSLLEHSSHSLKSRLIVKDIAAPALIKKTLNIQKDEDFIIRAKVMSTAIDKFEITIKEYGHKSKDSFISFIDEFLEQFWNQPIDRLKHLCKLMVCVSDMVEKPEILSQLLSKSISFITTVREVMHEQAKKLNLRASSKIRSADESTVVPLKMAFFSIFHILQNVGTMLESRVADHLTELTLDFMKIKDAELFQHCMGVAYILMRRHSAKSKSKASSSGMPEDEIYSIMNKHLEEGKYCLQGTLFVSEMILDAYMESQGKLDANKRSSKSSKMMKKKGQKKVLLDEGFIKLWRANAQYLFDIIEEKDLSDMRTILRALIIIREMAMQKEVQMRLAFQAVFSLCICQVIEIRVKARVVLKEISDFEARVFKEPIQFGIVQQLMESYAKSPLDRLQLIDLIWDFEATTGIQEGDNFLGRYLSSQIVKNNRPFVGTVESIFPKTYQNIDDIDKSLRTLEFQWLITIFYKPRHPIGQFSEVLRIFLRHIEDTVHSKPDRDGYYSLAFGRRLMESGKLWTLVRHCLEAIIEELSTNTSGKQESMAGVLSQTPSELLTYLVSHYGKSKKPREFTLRYQPSLEVCSSFLVVDSSIQEMVRSEVATPMVEEEKERLLTAIGAAMGETIQSDGVDWKQNCGRRNKGNQTEKGDGKKKHKKKGRRKNFLESDSEEDEWNESSDEEFEYRMSSLPQRNAINKVDERLRKSFAATKHDRGAKIRHIHQTQAQAVSNKENLAAKIKIEDEAERPNQGYRMKLRNTKNR